MSHNFGNLLKRTVTVNLEKFLEGGADKFSELETLLSEAEKTFTVAEVKKMKKSSDFPRTLNAFLDQYELSDEEKDYILSMRHENYSDKSDDEKVLLRKKIVKLRKIQE